MSLTDRSDCCQAPVHTSGDDGEKVTICNKCQRVCAIYIKPLDTPIRAMLHWSVLTGDAMNTYDQGKAILELNDKLYQMADAFGLGDDAAIKACKAVLDSMGLEYSNPGVDDTVVTKSL